MPAVALGHIRTGHGAYRDLTGPAGVGAAGVVPELAAGGPEFVVVGLAVAESAEELQMKRENLAGQCLDGLFLEKVEDTLRNHLSPGWLGDFAEAWIRELAEVPQGLAADLHWKKGRKYETLQRAALGAEKVVVVGWLVVLAHHHQ